MLRNSLKNIEEAVSEYALIDVTVPLLILIKLKCYI